MDDVKAAVKSTTIWGAIVGLLAMVANHFGYAIDAVLQSDIVTQIIAIVGIVGDVVAIFGRIFATKQISGVVSPPSE